MIRQVEFGFLKSRVCGIASAEPSWTWLLMNQSPYTAENLRKENTGWIGVDLDGTLAEYHGWRDGEIGQPILRMLERVVEWLNAGKEVRIFTARAADPPSCKSVERIQAWLALHGLPKLPVTCVKDKFMIELWDDRAVQVVPNTGQRVDGNTA